MSDVNLNEKAEVLRKEAVEKLTDAFFTIHRQIHPNFDPKMSLLPQKIERAIECIVSASMLEVVDVLRRGLTEPTDTTPKDICGGSCSCHKS